MSWKDKVDFIAIVWWTDLKHHKLFTGDFNNVSFGDSFATLVSASTMIDELETHDDSKLNPLIKELKSIPDGVYIAL